MSAEVRSLIKSLKYGIKVNTIFGITKIPSPTASMMIFHKDVSRKNYITLQCQTDLIKGLITEAEIENICAVVGQECSVSSDKCLISIYKYTQYILIAAAIILLPLPLIMTQYLGLIGIIASVLFYSCVIITMLLIQYLR